MLRKPQVTPRLFSWNPDLVNTTKPSRLLSVVRSMAFIYLFFFESLNPLQVSVFQSVVLVNWNIRGGSDGGGGEDFQEGRVCIFNKHPRA